MAINAVRSRYKSNGKIISDKAYYITIAFTLLFGFAVNAVEVVFFADFFAGLNPLIFFISYFVCAIVGILLNVFSQNAVVSFIGYLLVVVPIGGFLSLLLPSEGIAVVRSAFLATTLIGLIFSILAVAYPKFFTKLYAILFVSLLFACLYQLVAVFTNFAFGVWYEWLVVLVFAAYVGFDVSFAANRPHTYDCAVDSACGLYLDIINLFVRLLLILGRSRK